MADGSIPAQWEPKIVAFVCNWCTYVGADVAGTSRIQYAPNVRLIRLPCTGRIDPLFILKAFEQGADGVLVSGCHPGDCHYVSGNLLARRRFTIFRRLMEFLGVDLRRLQFSWVSATEGRKWAEVVNAVTEEVRAIGPAPSWGEKGEPWRALEPPTGEEAEPLAAPAEAQTQALRSLARRLLEQGEVGIVVGYEANRRGEVTPALITQPGEAERLLFDGRCRHNLSVYLTKELVRKQGKVGLVAKGCDVRSVVGLVQENQIRREDVVLLGMVCRGVYANGRLEARCHSCTVRTPHLYDHLIGEATSASALAEDPRDTEIARLEALSPQERWAYWQAQFARCIRCYACRAVCPLCYCEPCIAEKTRPQWIPPSAHGKGNLAWNIVRAMHLAGRCVGCDACARACPVGIRLDLINRKVALEIEREWGYRPGFDAEAPPPLTTFRPEDKEDFIR